MKNYIRGEVTYLFCCCCVQRLPKNPENLHPVVYFIINELSFDSLTCFVQNRKKYECDHFRMIVSEVRWNCWRKYSRRKRHYSSWRYKHWCCFSLHLNSAQGCMYVFGKAHIRSTQSLRRFTNATFETVPVLLWLTKKSHCQSDQVDS